MSTFEDAIPVILQHEGGWVSNPKDPGGETNYGISTLIIEREGLTNEYLSLPEGREPGWLKAMTEDTAKKIYKDLFWDRYGYGQLDDQTVATKIFDCSVNCGPGRAHVFAQEVAGTHADGIIGPQTLAAINAITPQSFVQAYADEMTTYYTNLVAKKPQLDVFLHNWLHRAQWGV